MTTKIIDLPDYKVAPPYDGGPWAWAWFFVRPYYWPLALYFFINLLRQSFFQVQPLFIGILVQLLETGRGVENPWLIALWLAVYAGLSLLVFFALIVIVPAGRTMDLMSKHVSLYGFRHYLTLSEEWHENRASGEKLQRLMTARGSVIDLLETAYWQLIPLPCMLIAVVIAIWGLDAPYYFILLFFGMIASYSLSGYVTGMWIARQFAKYNETLEHVVGGVYEFVVSTATVRFFNLKNHVMKRGRELESVNHEARVGIYRNIFKRWILMDMLALAWIVAITGLACYHYIYNGISLGAVTAIVFMTYTLWSELERMSITYSRLLEQWEGFKRITEILKIQPAIFDKPDARPLASRQPDIAFEAVSFHYNENKSVIQDFSLHIQPGEKVGLVGVSGAGKSTIVKLLMRFYDVEGGAVKIGGQDVRDITLSSLQQNIAVIPQDITLFNHPLMENIRYGRLAASDDEVIEAARKAHADEFVRHLPDGYQTMVGERGVKLSGGQRQRVAIARAILKDAPILILDEATSALDSESEQLIQESLKDLMRGKTVLAIAHRLSTIASLDRLIVMDNGKMIEQGSHAELISQGGVYARLWAMQSGGFLKD